MQTQMKLETLAGNEWEVYTAQSEPQLLHFYEPELGLFIAESPNVIERAVAAGYEPVSFLLDEKEVTPQLRQLYESCPEASVYFAPTALMDTLPGCHLTRGVLCLMRRKALPSVAEICKEAHRIAVLENVMNPTNLGAIFRSAAALGFDAVIMTDDCSNPFYRRASRVSMGTVFQIPWTYFPYPTDYRSAEKHYIPMLHEMGFQTAAMALSDDSIALDDPVLRSAGKLAVLLGSEFTGLHPETVRRSGFVVKIPMAHGVDSLNVAAASAVAFWELRFRN